jgi:hypothetical protein
MIGYADLWLEHSSPYDPLIGGKISCGGELLDRARLIPTYRGYYIKTARKTRRAVIIFFIIVGSGFQNTNHSVHILEPRQGTVDPVPCRTSAVEGKRYQNLQVCMAIYKLEYIPVGVHICPLDDPLRSV